MPLPPPHQPRVALRDIGPDGLFTLFLSHVAFIVSGGGLLVILFLRVLQVARRATTNPPEAGACLVFGMRLKDDEGVPDGYRLRLERAYLLHRDRPALDFFLLGGRTGSHNISESGAGRDVLLSLGVGDEHIHVEESSRHTLENIYNVQAMWEKQQDVILLSNRYHLARCLYMARGFGLQAHLCAAEDVFHETPGQWLLCLKEAYLLHWYVVGRSWACLTSNRTMLGRIGSCRPAP
ncbi:MAG: YdcF family protein [Pseudomonadota bacterium]